MIAKEKSLRRYCKRFKEIENYNKALASNELWDLHHRNEIDEKKSVQQLIDEGRYYDVDPSELIFLTHADHAALHGKHREVTEETRNKRSESVRKAFSSEEARKKLSEALKGKNAGKHHSEETREKMSNAIKKLWSNEEYRNKLSESRRGKTFSEEHRMKMSEAASKRKGETSSTFGRVWWNNGKVAKLSKECPGEGFIKGRLRK